MKYLSVLLAVLMTACASTSVPLSTNVNPVAPSKEVHVTGTGASLEEAKQDGFKRAIEYVVGTVIVSEKQAVSDQLIKNDILNYSAGYIDKYKVLSQRTEGSRITLSMNVTVKSSHIAEMILGRKSRTQLDGDNISTKYNSLLELRKTQEQATLG